MYSFLLKNYAHSIRDIGIFMVQQFGLPFYYRDIRAEAPKHLCKLQPNVAAAHDHQVRWQNIELEYRGVGQVRNIVNASKFGDGSPRSHIQKNLLRLQNISVDGNG